MIHQFLPENILQALGWTVIHSLWQGMLIALILAFVMLALRKKSSEIRYWVANIALLLMLLTSVITFFILHEKSGNVVAESTFFINENIVAESNFFQSISATFSNYFNQNLPLIVTVWLMGVAFFMLRMIGGLGYVFHLKNRHNQPLSDYWQQKLKHLSNQIPVEKSVELLESALVKVPMVIGYFKPVILMPIGAINGLSENQVEAILAHELAHIARNDYLLNILQSFVETLFYFNPAVWWISANIRLERENCCDDLAVKLCGNSLTYAKALVSLQEMHQAAPAFAMPFAGTKNQLLHRVKRILNQPQNKSNIMEKFTATTMLLAALLMLSFGMPTPADLLKSENEKEEITILMDEIETIDVSENDIVVRVSPKRDTVPAPKSGRQKYILKENGEETELHLKNGRVEKLVIDGKEIPEEDFEQYEEEIAEMQEELSNVPAPPAPPMPPMPDMPPAPPMPEHPEIPAPPAPPVAPTPPVPNKDSRKIITKMDVDGNTSIIIIEEEEEGEDAIDIEIEIDNEEDGSQTLIIDGKKFDTFSPDDLIVVEELVEPIYSSVWESVAKEPEIWEMKALQEAERALAEANIHLEELQFAYPDDNNFFWVKPDARNAFVLPNLPDSEENREYLNYLERYQEEYQERLKDGNLSEEWLKEQNEKMEKEFPNRPFVWAHPNVTLPELLFDSKLAYPENLFFEQKGLEKLEKLQLKLGKINEGLDGYHYIYEDLDKLKNYKGSDAYLEILKFYEEEMVKDGLVKKGKLKKFELSNKEFKINGKKQSDKHLKKYLELLDKQQKMKLKGKSKFYFKADESY